MLKNGFFTSESVSEGHPDKVADQISDAILDEFLRQDASSRVACEVLLAPGLIVVAGEVNSKCYVDITSIVKKVLKNIGYDDPKKGMDYRSCSVLTTINHQSPDIAKAVKIGKKQGAGDQGIMFGYAVDETEELMPLGISLSHKLMQELARLRKSGKDFIWPDSKSQVTVQYKDGKVQAIDSVVISTQHSYDITLPELSKFIIEELIKKIVPKKYLTSSTRFIINPAGEFNIGGPQADCGLTGRKIVVDTYGGYGSTGGGAFSGKDPSKVDRSGAYIARHIAKNLVASKLVSKCLVQLSYAIGLHRPTSVYVEDYGTATVSTEHLEKLIMDNWDLSPQGIIQELDLLKPKYLSTSVYGHFGREEPGFTWEQTNKAHLLK